jgi:poly-gamma-glutamate synthesis protein (capsule biosynthesis protein)
MRLALAGDTMLGRGVAASLAHEDPRSLVAPELAELMRAADVAVLNLECCISTRGEPWRLPGKPFHFRAPPRAVDLLVHLGIGCVTLANNHALDFGEEALVDTFDHLASAGIAGVGAGRDRDQARTPVSLTIGDEVLTVVAFTDHPAEFAARRCRPGVAFTDLAWGLDGWVYDAIAEGRGCVLVTPHWGPNMASGPRPYVRRAARQLMKAGADLVAGHSAHVFHGVEGSVLYDLGDFVDDYAVDQSLRNDLGLLFLVELDEDGLRRVEAVPLKLDYCHTRLADGDDAAWIARRLREACAAFGTEVRQDGERLVVG